MERKYQMKFRVSEEEKKQIEMNAEKEGFASAASYMRSRSLNSQQGTLYLHQKCEIRDCLQKMDELADNDSRMNCYVQRIHNILDEAGEE